MVMRNGSSVVLAGLFLAAAASAQEVPHRVQPALPARLEAGRGAVTVTLPNLPIGLYSFYLYGTIDPQGRERLERVWKPCPMEFTARDTAGNVVAQGRRLLKQSFATRRMQGFHLHVFAPGAYTATFRLTPAAQEIAVIERVEVVDQLAGLPDAAIKRSQNLRHGAAAVLPTLTEERKRRDDLIWSALPPLNIHLQVHGQVAQFRNPPEGVRLPAWDFKALAGMPSHQRIRNLFTPLDIVDTATGEVVLSHADLLAGKPLSGGGWTDDGTGIYFAQQQAYVSPLANLLGQRVQMFVGLLGAWDYRGYSIARRFFEQGDPEAGHDAALALVRVALDWPALEMNLHEHRLCTHSPDFEFNSDWSDPRRRNGKYFYSGWSGGMAVDFMTAYDQVFPYIHDNAVFAEAVNRFIPWVKTPEDVVRFLDRYLVWGSVRDFRRNIIRAAPVEDIAGEVLGPHALTAELFDLTRQHAAIYPFEGTYQELYGCALARLGHYHIGSTGYAAGDAAEQIRKALSARRAREAGLPLKMDLSDVERYPKVRRAADFLIDQWVGGGFWLTVGDASGGSHAGRDAMRRLAMMREASEAAVALWDDPRHAWLLKNLHNVADEKIAALAEGVRNPVLHNTSRFLPGWAGILEMNPEATDPREKTAAFMLVNVGQGHSHSDFLDLNLFAMGLPLAVDLACRDEGNNWSRPGAGWSFLHNHAIAHDTDDPRAAGAQSGEPWLRAFAPPLMRGTYVDAAGKVRLDRDVLLMQVGDTQTYYAFDVQTLSGGTTHTWCFHGVESHDLDLNVPLRTEVVRWTDRMLPERGEGDLPPSQRVGQAVDSLQAVWTATREPREYGHYFRNGGVVRTVALEPHVLGDLYDADLPPVKVRATLLGHAQATVLSAKPFSQPYAYAFPFLWVQAPAPADGVSVYPAVYEWYRGDAPVVAEAKLVQRRPLIVEVTTSSGQVDTYRLEGDAFAAVSRDAQGVRWAQLSDGAALSVPGLQLQAAAARYSAPIADIDYVARRLRTAAPLPKDPVAVIGNALRQSTLELFGEGTEFTWKDDLLAHEGRITRIETPDDETIRLETNQRLFHAGDGNRKPEGFTVTNEDHTWHFRGGKVVRRPGGARLTPEVFADANGDGFIHAKTYEIGVGDAVVVPANIIVRRTAKGYEVLTNVAVQGNVAGLRLSLRPSTEWQPVARPN